MNKKYSAVLMSFIIANSTLAAHIVTETREGSTPVSRTDTYANAAGDLRVEERGYASSDSVADAGNSTSTGKHSPGKVRDTMLFQTKDNAMVVLEGKTCRRMTTDSNPLKEMGMPAGMDMGQMNQQMNDAMKQAGAAMAEAMAKARKDGMSEEQLRTLEQFTKPVMEAAQPKTRGAIEVYALDKKTKVGKYSAEGFGVRDASGTETHRVWIADESDVPGSKHVRKAMLGMMDAFADFLDNMGGAALMDTGLTAVFQKPEFSDKYPVRIEDLESGEVTEVIEASAKGNADFYPDCVEKDMFER